jgi:hypothetical protein
MDGWDGLHGTSFTALFFNRHKMHRLYCCIPSRKAQDRTERGKRAEWELVVYMCMHVRWSITASKSGVEK